MDMLHVLGIVLAIVAIIYAAMKGFSIIIVAPMAALIVILTNQMDLFATLLGSEASYIAGLTDFIVNFFAVFLLGSLLAKYIDKSGAAQQIAESIVAKTGTEKPFAVLAALLAITAFLTYGGVSVFVVIFVLLPLAKPLFKKLNIAWNLVAIPIQAGAGTFTMTMLPATPSIQNVVPTAYLGTTLTAAPLLGIIGSVTALAFGLWYMRFALRKSLANKETYADFHVQEDDNARKEKTPSLMRSVTPILLLIAINIVGSALGFANIILIGLATAILASAILFKDYLPSQQAVLNEGATGSIMPIILTSSAVAFGVVVTLAPGFIHIADLILNIPGNPLISLSVASALFGGITGSASGSLGIVMEAFSQSYLAMGIHPEVIHRVSAVASAVLTIMPHSGAILSFMALAGLNHKNSFKYQFIAVTGANFLALVVVIIAATLLY